MKATQVKKELQKLADPVKAQFLQGFFKTGKGGYAEGDKFLGISVPVQRKIARKYQDLELLEVSKLLQSEFHEHRFTALEILVFTYEKAVEADRKRMVTFYLEHAASINNWDLVDTSAPYILGNWLIDKDRRVLDKLARSKRMWERRIAIVSTWAFIRKRDFAATLRVAAALLRDKHDLIHKATGWMLREVGKKSEETLTTFLDQHCTVMPRTMLRYAIERFPQAQRKRYLGLR